MTSLNGKIAVVTGGTSGIGEAASRSFRDAGATVVVMGSSAAKLDHARTEFGLEGEQCDVASTASISRAMEAVGARHRRIDILFACAGIPGAMLPVEATDEAEFDRVVTVNLKGAFFTVQKALPYIGDGGSIILTSSVGAHQAMPMNCAYAAAKAGVRSLGRSLAEALQPRGIRVNVLTPGLFDTPLFDAMGDQRAAVMAMIAQRIPMGRAGDPVEAAAAALFLASSASSFMTGAELKVSGGQTDL